MAPSPSPQRGRPGGITPNRFGAGRSALIGESPSGRESRDSAGVGGGGGLGPRGASSQDYIKASSNAWALPPSSVDRLANGFSKMQAPSGGGGGSMAEQMSKNPVNAPSFGVPSSARSAGLTPPSSHNGMLRRSVNAR